MFGTPVEVVALKAQLAEAIAERDAYKKMREDAKEELSEMKDEMRDIKWKLTTVEKEAELATEKKLQELRKSMQESLIKSDLLRTEALARLEIYEKTDTKADANTIKDMVKQLIDVVGKQSLNVISTGNK